MNLLQAACRIVIPVAGLATTGAIFWKLWRFDERYERTSRLDLSIEIPFLFGLIFLWLALLLWQYERRQWRPYTRCRRCGYDIQSLRGMAARCPECGARI